ncbi:MAG: type II secretion system F family protein [Lentisphaeraceae bacterium]|nr:type II secretion system F family protein [Lentisphaeraceae bacterium]
MFLYTILGNFASTGALLLQSGLTVVESLRLLSGLSGFRIFQDVVNKAHSSVLKGKSLTDALEDPLMPPLVLNIVAVGEETGGLPDVLNELGSFYNRELNGKIRFFVSIIEPALLIVVGSLVAVVYFALFQAIIVMIGG